MKKILANLRAKSPEFRAGLSVVLALIVTAAIASLWGIALAPEKKDDGPKAPGPFAALFRSIGGIVKETKFKSEPAKPVPAARSDYEIVDQSNAVYDETNPYQNSAQ